MAPPTDPNVQKILDIVTQDLLVDKITDANIHMLIGQVNEQNLRLIQIEQQVQQILAILTVQATSLTVTFQVEGASMGANATLVIGQTANATAHEWSGLAGTGTELALAGPIAWTSSDPTIAMVDPASGLVTAVAAGTAQIMASDPKAGTAGLNGFGTVSDTPLVAQSLTVDIAPN